MSKFLICECCNQTYLEEDMSKNNKNMCCSCWCYTRPKDKRIAELEEQLKDSIRPKFKVGDKAYAIIDTMFYTDVFPVDIVGVMFGYKVYDGQFTTNQNYIRVYATKEEAEAKLEELKGENK